jgi:hypothetical protein
MSKLVCILSVGLLLSCGDSLEVENVDPQGSVGGLVYDAVTRQPLAGVQLGLVAGGRSFDAQTSAEDGSFSFDGVPAGDVIVSFTPPDGYQPAYLRGTLSNAAGDFPTGNATLTLGPIGMIPLSRSFAVRVLDQFGKPVSGYAVVVRTFAQYIDLSTGVAAGRGETVTTVTSDTNGYASLPSFPDFVGMGPSVNDSVLILLPPLDADADGVFEFGGGDRLFAARTLTDPTPDVILHAGYTTQLQIRASTIPVLAGSGGVSPSAAVLGISDAVHIAFNLPIQDDVAVTVSDEYGTPLATMPGLSVRDDNLTVNFGAAPLMPGNEYNITVHAIAAVGERMVTGDFAAPFFTRAINDTVTVTAISRDPITQAVDLTFSEPIGLGNAANNTLSGGNCVLFFNADLGGGATIGDYPSELGALDCFVALSSSEPNPAGQAGLSGYTRHWRFTAPNNSGGNPLPSNTRVHILWDRVNNGSFRVERPDGTAVGNMTDGSSIPIP